MPDPFAVTFYRPFAEERRTSMDSYAASLATSLQTNFATQCHPMQYQPALLRWRATAQHAVQPGSLRVRLSRFVTYPIHARMVQRDVNHIVDQGYGHLLGTLDPARTVVTVHDLIPLLHWMGKIPGAPPRSRPWLNLIPIALLPRARCLIAVSEQTKRDLIAYAGCRPEQIHVVYSGINPAFRPLDELALTAARRRLHLPENGIKRVLVVGSLFYKNITGSLQAFARLRSRFPGTVHLLKAGAATPEWEAGVASLGLHDAAFCLGFIPADLLPAAYNLVDCLLFPSLYEGAGWPPIEAMACGTPVVASNAASLPEMLGDAALTADPTDYDGIADALLRVLTDESTHIILKHWGREQARHFTWDRAAQQTFAIYDQIVSQP